MTPLPETTIHRHPQPNQQPYSATDNGDPSELFRRNPLGENSQRNPMERASAASLRAAFRANPPNHHNNPATIRSVTPDLPDTSLSDAPYLGPRGDTSPRSIPGGSYRRQGMVFNDAFSGSYESTESSPPPVTNRLASSTIRPRTRTMDTAMLSGQRATPPGFESRHRVGSVSSSSASQGLGDEPRHPAGGLESTGFPTIMGGRVSDTSASSSTKGDKKLSSRKLMKRRSSRPTSPLIAMPPSVDCLPFPIPTDDPQKIILLINALCGKMRGEIEYQGETGGTWHSGVAYIDDDRNCLMFDSGQSGPFHIPLVADLRGCRILPVDYPEAGKRCLELVSSHPIIEVLLHPLVADEFDLWLAALLCWQQLRPTAVKLSGAKPSSPVSPVRPELKRRVLSADGSKSTNIIKVGKVQVWDKGPAANPRAIVKRSSTRDQRSPLMSWRRVSCILQDNGEFKLMTENDITILSVVDLAQLSRYAIQQLDRTVLDEEYCIAIFPMYAVTSKQLSIFRPIYLALDSRTHFEVWFALLRAFAVPDVYRVDDPEKDEVEEVDDVEKNHNGEVFRVERTILVRVTEAKIKPKAIPSTEQQTPEKPERQERSHSHRSVETDPLVGNYLAEVILDGEVRGRTILKMATKNPFWREDCEFIDLPPTLPKLSVVLKRVEGSGTPTPFVPTSAPKVSNSTETIFGTVELSWKETGSKDTEQWLNIVDEKQDTIGTMLIRVAHEELAVLLAKEYQTLGDMLHSFPAGLTSFIASALPGHLRRLAELFLNIFQVSGSTGEWLMAMVEDEIDGIGNQATIKKYRFSSRLKSNDSVESTDRELIVRDMSKSLAGEANLLFRGNTLLTQSLEFHMRRLGKDYLEDILQEKLFEINELNPDCEVDPAKIHNTGDLENHWNKLIDITTEVWLCIAASAKKIHPELRHILKYIRAVAEDRYGDFLRPVTYTSVSGFLFLRFICPAILSPKLFGLLRDHPRPRAQRTFTLIAKALQKMANLSTFGKREEWMEPMNRFLSAQRTKFRDYIDQVCDIPAERGMRSLPPSYSTPVTILGRLGPTAREGFPSLPFLIDQARNYATLVKMWVDLKPTDANKRASFEGPLIAFDSLCLKLQLRADSCLAKHEALRTGDLDTSTDDLAELVDQASLIESLGYTTVGPATYVDSDLSPPPTSTMPMFPIPSSGSSDEPVAGTSTPTSRKSKDLKRARDIPEVKGRLRHVSSGHSISKGKNGKMGGRLLSGIMRIGGSRDGRAESPDSKTLKEGGK